MKKYFTHPETSVIKVDGEVALLAGSPDVSPDEIGLNNGRGCGIQLTKRHTLFDDDDDDSDNEW